MCGVSGGKNGRGNWLEFGDCETVVGMEQIRDHIWQEEEFLEESLGVGGESQGDATPMQNQTAHFRESPYYRVHHAEPWVSRG